MWEATPDIGTRNVEWAPAHWLADGMDTVEEDARDSFERASLSSGGGRFVRGAGIATTGGGVGEGEGEGDLGRELGRGEVSVRGEGRTTKLIERDVRIGSSV
jgi:hypothetical protein